MMTVICYNSQLYSPHLGKRLTVCVLADCGDLQRKSATDQTPEISALSGPRERMKPARVISLKR
jgi:hypothetical protein